MNEQFLKLFCATTRCLFGKTPPNQWMGSSFVAAAELFSLAAVSKQSERVLGVGRS